MDRLGKKFTSAIPTDVFKKEDKLQQLEVTPQYLEQRQIDHFTDLIAAINYQITGDGSTEQKDAALRVLERSRWYQSMDGKYLAKDDWIKLKNCYTCQLAQVLNKLEAQAVNEEFVKGWVQWIQGHTELADVLLKSWWWWVVPTDLRSAEDNLRAELSKQRSVKEIMNDKTLIKPWEKRKLFGAEFDLYLTEFVSRKYDFERDILKLRIQIPNDLEKSWKYYKYIIKEMKLLESDFMSGYFEPYLRESPSSSHGDDLPVRQDPLPPNPPGGSALPPPPRSFSDDKKPSEKDPEEEMETEEEKREEREEPIKHPVVNISVEAQPTSCIRDLQETVERGDEFQQAAARVRYGGFQAPTTPFPDQPPPPPPQTMYIRDQERERELERDRDLYSQQLQAQKIEHTRTIQQHGIELQQKEHARKELERLHGHEKKLAEINLEAEETRHKMAKEQTTKRDARIKELEVAHANLLREKNSALTGDTKKINELNDALELSRIDLRAAQEARTSEFIKNTADFEKLNAQIQLLAPYPQAFQTESEKVVAQAAEIHRLEREHSEAVQTAANLNHLLNKQELSRTPEIIGQELGPIVDLMKKYREMKDKIDNIEDHNRMMEVFRMRLDPLNEKLASTASLFRKHGSKNEQIEELHSLLSRMRANPESGLEGGKIKVRKFAGSMNPQYKQIKDLRKQVKGLQQQAYANSNSSFIELKSVRDQLDAANAKGDVLLADYNAKIQGNVGLRSEIDRLKEELETMTNTAQFNEGRVKELQGTFAVGLQRVNAEAQLLTSVNQMARKGDEALTRLERENRRLNTQISRLSREARQRAERVTPPAPVPETLAPIPPIANEQLASNVAGIRQQEEALQSAGIESPAELETQAEAAEDQANKLELATTQRVQSWIEEQKVASKYLNTFEIKVNALKKGMLGGAHFFPEHDTVRENLSENINASLQTKAASPELLQEISKANFYELAIESQAEDDFITHIERNKSDAARKQIAVSRFQQIREKAEFYAGLRDQITGAGWRNQALTPENEQEFLQWKKNTSSAIQASEWGGRKEAIKFETDSNAYFIHKKLYSMYSEKIEKGLSGLGIQSGDLSDAGKTALHQLVTQHGGGDLQTKLELVQKAEAGAISYSTLSSYESGNLTAEQANAVATKNIDVSIPINMAAAASNVSTVVNRMAEMVYLIASSQHARSIVSGIPERLRVGGRRRRMALTQGQIHGT